MSARPYKGWKGWTMRCGGLVVLALSASRCATVPEEAGFPDVENRVGERRGERIHWNRGLAEDAAVATEIEALLGEPVTLAAAIQIALLNNPDLQAMYEALGVAQADLVQAGLLENPVFGASLRIPDHDRSGSRTTSFTREISGGLSLTRSADMTEWGREIGQSLSVERSSESSINQNIWEFTLVQNFLDLLMLPMRKRLAAAHFEQTKLEVSHRVLMFAGEVERSYYEYVSALQLSELFATVSQATGAASEFAVRQYEAGNLSRLAMSRENAFHAKALLDVAHAQLEARLARERVNRLLGIWGGDTTWQLASSRLDPLPESEIKPGRLESFAIGNRLDLAAAVRELETLVFGVKSARRWRWLGLLDFSVSTEREMDGVYVTGPALELELPVFDQGQADVAIAESDLRAGSQRVTSLALQVRSETREAWERLRSSRETVAYYERVLLPVHQRIVDEAQLHHNAMLIGVYELLLDKQEQIMAAQGYVEALRDYWIARTALQMALGGAFPEELAAAGASSEPEEEEPAIDEPKPEGAAPSAHQHD